MASVVGVAPRRRGAWIGIIAVYAYAASTGVTLAEDCVRYCGAGKCTAGFSCPYAPDRAAEREYCCGAGHMQYCCTQTQKYGPQQENIQPNWVHVGVACGAVLVVLLVALLLSCLFCRCCPLYRKRHIDSEKPKGPIQNCEKDQIDGIQVACHENGISHVNVDGSHYYVNKLQPKDLLFHYLDDDRPSYEAGSQLSLAKHASLLGSQYSLGAASTLSAGHTSLLSTSLSVGQSSMVSSALSTRSQLFRPMSASSAKENHGYHHGSIISLETNL